MDKRLSDDEVIEIIRTFDSGGYSTEEEDEAKIALLNATYPGISDLIFWCREKLTAEQILEKAKEQAKPILL